MNEESKCELCNSTDQLKMYIVPAALTDNTEGSILLCETCLDQIEDPNKMEVNHWRCLSESMWSAEPAVQVVSWRMLNRLKTESWARDLLDILYLDDETLAWAKAGEENDPEQGAVIHVDSNGTVLNAGDTIVLTKDLNVKGAGFTAKRGTAVRGISLVFDNAEQIEGKVNGQQIVILTKFVKKSN